MKKYNWIICILSAIIIVTNVISLYQHIELEKRNNILAKDNEQLLLDLADRDNQIYELNLEIKTTNKALAETSLTLDSVAKELENAKIDGELIDLDYAGTFTCTAYCCEKRPHICGTGSGKTASGAPVTADVSCAVADLELFPYGTIIYIEDVGIRIVQDTGSFKPNKIDCAVDTHKHASNWEGQGKHKVYIINIKGE